MMVIVTRRSARTGASYGRPWTRIRISSIQRLYLYCPHRWTCLCRNDCHSVTNVLAGEKKQTVPCMSCIALSMKM